MTNKYMKSCSTAFVIVEMQIKTTVRINLYPYFSHVHKNELKIDQRSKYKLKL